MLRAAGGGPDRVFQVALAAARQAGLLGRGEYWTRPRWYPRSAGSWSAPCPNPIAPMPVLRHSRPHGWLPSHDAVDDRSAGSNCPAVGKLLARPHPYRWRL